MSYQWDAAEYEKNSSPQQLWARDALRGLTFGGDERVLDIGCGDGKVTAELAAYVPDGSVLGIDSSETMVEFAHRHFPPAFFPNLQFRWGDATRLTFRHEFDLVVSFASLHWVADHPAVLAGIKRALTPSGQTLLQFGGRGNAALISSVANELITESRWKAYFTDFTYPWFFYGIDEYRGFMREAGLSPKRIELIPKDMVHEGKEGLKGWLRTVFLPYTGRVPDALRETFVEELARAYLLQRPPDAHGLVHVQMVRLEVQATP